MASANAFIQILREILGNEPASLVDVGASLGIHPRWAPFKDLLRVVGFEPNEDEFHKIPKVRGDLWIKAAVAGTMGQRTLYITKRFNNCSLLRPNAKMIAQLEWGDDFDVVREETLDCVSLDDSLAEYGVRPDFLKLDTQGNEWEILNGAQRCLSEDVVFIEVETEFCQLYENQRVFADVDCMLRERGFYLHDMANHLFVKPRGLSGIGGPKGRLIQADCLYFKEPSVLMSLPDAKLASATIAYSAYGYPEAALHLLNLAATGGRSVPHVDRLRRFLREFRHSSRWLDGLPGRRLLTNCAKRFNLDFRPVEHALWENELGNRLGIPK